MMMVESNDIKILIEVSHSNLSVGLEQTEKHQSRINHLKSPEEASHGVKGRVGLRDVYHTHIKDASEILTAENPTWAKKDILAEARRLPESYWFACFAMFFDGQSVLLAFKKLVIYHHHHHHHHHCTAEVEDASITSSFDQSNDA